MGSDPRGVEYAMRAVGPEALPIEWMPFDHLVVWVAELCDSVVTKMHQRRLVERFGRLSGHEVRHERAGVFVKEHVRTWGTRVPLWKLRVVHCVFLAAQPRVVALVSEELFVER